MKAGRYAVSVQWGSGHHYFVHTDNSLELSVAEVNKHKQALARRRPKHNLVPTVHLWEQKEV